MNTMPEGELVPRQGWWSRNWKWVVPVGCLGLLLSCGCLGALLFGAGWQAMSGTGVYVEAVTRAKQSPEVREVLGTPVEASLMHQGSFQSVNGRSAARFTVPLKGPKAEGTLDVEAYKEDEQWTFTTLRLEVPGQPAIDVLTGDLEPVDPALPSPGSLPDVEPLPDDEPGSGAPSEPADPEEQEEPSDRTQGNKKHEDIHL